jgi:hypothetical protein
MMFSAIKYQLQIWRLNRELERIDRRYLPAREAEKGANANPPPWSGEYGQARYALMGRIRVLETSDLLRRAARERVPAPDDGDENAWLEAHGGGWFLSDAAFAALRSAIRKERNEKWDFRFKVLGVLGLFVSMATGFIGALIGLVAALKK